MEKQLGSSTRRLRNERILTTDALEFAASKPGWRESGCSVSFNEFQFQIFTILPEDDKSVSKASIRTTHSDSCTAFELLLLKSHSRLFFAQILIPDGIFCYVGILVQSVNMSWTSELHLQHTDLVVTWDSRILLVLVDSSTPHIYQLVLYEVPAVLP